MRFGDFLLNSGQISQTQLVAVLREQQDRQRSMAQLAVNDELLTMKEVAEIAATLGSDLGSSFEECAVQGGKLLAIDVVFLLEAQRRTRPKLGELLVEMGFLQPEVKERLLETFHAVSQSCA